MAPAMKPRLSACRQRSQWTGLGIRCIFFRCSESPIFPTAGFPERGTEHRGVGIRERMPPCYIERPGGTGDFLFMVFHEPIQFGEASPSAELRPGHGRFLVARRAPLLRPSPASLEPFLDSLRRCPGQPGSPGGANPGRPPLSAARSLPDRKHLFSFHEELSGRVQARPGHHRHTLST